MNMTTTSPLVVAVLPTYNGERFLAEQLESLLGQTHRPLLVLARDDGSKDQTCAILDDYSSRHPDVFRVISDDLGNLGARGSFALLLAEAAQINAEDGSPAYVALADQDDTWHPEKLATLMKEIEALEAGSPHIPAIVHGDLKVVTAEGKEIASSMAAYQGLRPDRSSLAAQLISNTVTGCTTLMNQALVKASLPVPAEAIMHDWWISLCASAFGRRRYVTSPLVNYRQHGFNTIGAKEWIKPKRFRNIFVHLMDDSHRETFNSNARQASAFLRTYGRHLTWKQRLVTRLTMALSLHFPPLQRLIFRTLRVL